MRRCLAVVGIAVLSACAGGGGQTSPVPGGATTSAKPTTTSLQISVPHVAATATAERRAPDYISASTQSITVDVKPHGSGTSVTGFPITANLTTSSAGCTSTLIATVCNVQLSLAPANYDVTLTTFSGTGGTGSRLSAAQSMPLNVVEGQANAVPLALGGIPTSVQIVASGGGAAAGQGFVYTLGAGASGTLSAYGVDAAGNTIVGAGAPAITAATDDATRITVTQPGATTPNAIGIASLGANSIAHVTATVTPVAGSGAGPISRTVTVQTPNLPLLYFTTFTTLRIVDMTGTVVTRPVTTGFDSLPSQVTGMAYNPTNGLLYMGIQGSNNQVVAYDKNGNAQPLAPAASGLSTALGIAFDPANNWVYVGGLAKAFDAGGNVHTLSATVNAGYGMTYDPQHNVIAGGGTTTYNADGTVHGSLSFTGGVGSVTYNAFNGWYYVTTAYPTTVAAYDTSGTPQSLPVGSFTLQSGSEQIAGIVADPATGNVFLTTNGNNTYGFDLNGNALPLPWHNLTVGAPSDVAGMVLVTPQ